MQPFNVIYFQPLKHYHYKAVNIAVRSGDIEFSKIEFLTAFKEFRTQAFKQLIILSAFKKIGIMSYNLEQVLRPL
jgi:hypothetical protein